MMETDVSQGGGWRHFFRRQPGRVCVAVALALAAGFRLAGAWWYALSPNPDYAVVVQMARHMARRFSMHRHPGATLCAGTPARVIREL